MRVLVEGPLFNVFKRDDYENKKTGEVTRGKRYVQIKVEREQKNGSIKHDILDISLDYDDNKKYEEMIGKVVQIPCGVIADGKVTFYGVL
jgi:hypothetical protein